MEGKIAPLISNFNDLLNGLSKPFSLLLPKNSPDFDLGVVGFIEAVDVFFNRFFVGGHVGSLGFVIGIAADDSWLGNRIH